MIDHLVLATADLARGSQLVTELLGVSPTAGGSHVGIGTRNELVSLGCARYLEIIGPDPDQPDPAMPRPFGVDRLVQPVLVAWCARPRRPLADVIGKAGQHGIELGPVASMSRRRPDGVLLEWQLTFPQLDGPLGGALPFLIDWGASPHPTDTLPRGPRLIELEIFSPRPQVIATALDIVGVVAGCAVHESDRVSLKARVATDHGEVTLSS